MNRADAEEFTQSLGQIVGGSYRQIQLAKRLGVPDALGMTVEEWVQQRLGGYVRYTIEERRKIVHELSGEGLSQRQVGEVLGVDPMTVNRDLHTVENATPKPSSEPSNVANATPQPASINDHESETAQAGPPVNGHDHAKLQRLAAWRIIEWLERHTYFFEGEHAEYHARCLLEFPQECPIEGDPIALLHVWHAHLGAFLDRLEQTDGD